jgi:hypothetical protein
MKKKVVVPSTWREKPVQDNTIAKRTPRARLGKQKEREMALSG